MRRRHENKRIITLHNDKMFIPNLDVIWADQIQNLPGLRNLPNTSPLGQTATGRCRYYSVLRIMYSHDASSEHADFHYH